MFFAVYFIWYIRQPGKLKRFFLVLAVMLLSARLLQPMAALPHKSMSALQQFFVNSLPSLGLALGMAAVTAVLCLLDHKQPGLMLPKALQWVALALFGTALAAVLVAMVCFTRNPELPLEGVWQFLRLEDTWGTNRGFMWRRSLDIFRDFSLWRKLFGSGPDTFYYMFQPYFEELTKYWTSSTNAAHNEYLNYLITVGILGAAAYCTALVSGLIHCLRRTKYDPMGAVFFAAVICYGAQALVSIAQPITTPLFILFLALCAGMKDARDPTER